MKLLDYLIKILPSKPVFAHCDIPCGIYDPHQAQMAAHTVIRMTKLISETKEEKSPVDSSSIHKISRMTRVKEKHADRVEEEIVTLWADYFNEEHFKEHQDLKDLIEKTVKLIGKVRQEVNIEASQELLTNVQTIAEIFWKTKGLEPTKIPSGYPTEGEIVSHK